MYEHMSTGVSIANTCSDTNVKYANIINFIKKVQGFQSLITLITYY